MAERFNGPYKTVIQAFRPPHSEMIPGVIYLTTCERDGDASPEKIQMAGYICPCGCGQETHMSLKPHWQNGWTYELHPDGTVSFNPSIFHHQTCGAHFFIKHGLVQWC
jgi:hypothetical protein